MDSKGKRAVACSQELPRIVAMREVRRRANERPVWLQALHPNR